MHSTTSTVILFTLLSVALSYPNGAPTKACDDLVPSPKGHKSIISQKDSPYILESKVIQNTLKLKISGVPPFQRFAIQIRKSSVNSLAGEFSWDDEYVKYMKCVPEAPRASITQSKARSRDQLEVFWSWPDPSAPKDESYTITYTVVTNREHFWVKSTPVTFSKRTRNY